MVKSGVSDAGNCCGGGVVPPFAIDNTNASLWRGLVAGASPGGGADGSAAGSSHELISAVSPCRK